jgi:hypothetical protein
MYRNFFLTARSTGPTHRSSISMGPHSNPPSRIDSGCLGVQLPCLKKEEVKEPHRYVASVVMPFRPDLPQISAFTIK